jgi:Protein of unknown function (DUF2946)
MRIRIKTLISLSRKSLLALTAVAVACKLLIPIGYMPAPISGGAPLMFCPDATAAVSLHARAHHREGHGKGGSELKWDHCPYGALAKSAPISITLAAPIAPGAATPVPVLREPVRTGIRLAAFRARAPPIPLA